MRRTWIVLAIVVLAVMLVAMPGFAEGPTAREGMGPGHGKDATVFALQGCITENGINTEEKTIEVYIVKSMNRLDLPESATIYTDGTTRFFEWEEGEQSPISFGELAVGDPVSVNGHVEENVLRAAQVTVNPDCPVLFGVCDQD